MPNRKWTDSSGVEWFSVDIPVTRTRNHGRNLIGLAFEECEGEDHNACLAANSKATIMRASEWIADRFGLPVVLRETARNYRSPEEIQPRPRMREMPEDVQLGPDWGQRRTYQTRVRRVSRDVQGYRVEYSGGSTENMTQDEAFNYYAERLRGQSNEDFNNNLNAILQHYNQVRETLVARNEPVEPMIQERAEAIRRYYETNPTAWPFNSNQPLPSEIEDS